MKKLLSITLALILLLSLAACTGKTTPAESSPSPSEPVAQESADAPQSPSPSQAAKPAISVGFLKGPTGVGAAQLMERNDGGEANADYDITLEADVSSITSAFISGQLDLAAVPTNVASVLYNKLEGGVRLIAINTLSVLYILEKGDTVSSIADLRGKTVYATGQGSNPEYVLNYVLRENGLEPGVDVTIEFMDSAELATQMASGNLDLCMLPVPNATTVLMKNADVRTALSIGDEWEKTSSGSTLSQGCIVARADADDLDAKVAAFLDDYERSIIFMSDSSNIDSAAELAVKYEIIGSAEIAKAAIPNCGLTFITGTEKLKECVAGYYDVLFSADPTSVGGAVPGDDFYYVG